MCERINRRSVGHRRRFCDRTSSTGAESAKSGGTAARCLVCDRHQRTSDWPLWGSNNSQFWTTTIDGPLAELTIGITNRWPSADTSKPSYRVNGSSRFGADGEKRCRGAELGFRREPDRNRLHSSIKAEIEQLPAIPPPPHRLSACAAKQGSVRQSRSAHPPTEKPGCRLRGGRTRSK